MAVSVYLHSGERRIVEEADGAHMHGYFFVLPRRAKDQTTTVVTMMASTSGPTSTNRPSAEGREAEGGEEAMTPHQGTSMFWDNEKDSVWTQRWKNGVFLKWWVKNQTRDAVLPWVVLVALILLALIGLAKLFGMPFGLRTAG
jgi:hypothetical protein